MDESLIAELVVYVLIGFLFIGVVVVAVFGIKGSNATTVYGATAEFYTKDKKAAMETIIEQKAKKKMEEQENGELE